MKIKIFFIILLVIVPRFLFAEFTVYFDCNRFISEQDNTIFEITYKVLHKDLQFALLNKKPVAQISVEFFIYNASGKELYKQEFSRRISLDKAEDTQDEDFFYIDKIIAQVRPGKYRFYVKITDQVSKDKIVWDKTISSLPVDEYSFSNLEINSFSIEDDKKSSQSFRRDGRIFLVNPNKVFYPNKQADFTYYFEYYPAKNDSSISEISISLFDEKGKKVFEQMEAWIPTTWKGVFWKKVPISDLNYGKYTLQVTATNPQISGDNRISKATNIFLNEKKEESEPFDLKREYEIAKYFLSNTDQKKYDKLDENGKAAYLKKFWRSNDPNPITEKNEIKELIIQRIEVAKNKYSSVGQNWETDMGRIYVRNGKPSEVIEKSYEYRAKPYTVWKYYEKGEKRVYLFVDFSGQSNYRLVYCENDDTEVTDPGWQDYLGPYFDESVLE